MATHGDMLKAYAEAKGTPARTLDDVKASLAYAKRINSEQEVARLMLRHGRLTDEARAYVAAYK